MAPKKGKRKVLEGFDLHESVVMPNPNHAMERQMVISRQYGGPYTMDELEETYDYSSCCDCSPFKMFLLFLLIAGIIIGILFATNTLGPDGKLRSSSDSSNGGITDDDFLFSTQDGGFGSGGYNGGGGGGGGNPFTTTTSTPAPGGSDFVDSLPDPSAIEQQKTNCLNSVCTTPSCACNGKTSPPRNLDSNAIPQMVMLTFDDSINDDNMDYFNQIITGRTNPNGCPISSTFYVSHRGTNYRYVQSLYRRRQEIAGHSITHERSGEWAKEIVGQREILRNFARIPSDRMPGFRAPFLESGGEEQWVVMARNGFKYDSTLVEINNHEPIFPYTFEYQKSTTCVIEPCPSQYSYPGIWEMPVTQWNSHIDNVTDYGMLDEYVPRDKADVLAYLRHNFNRHFLTNRAPFNMYLHWYWFRDYPFTFEALLEFIDELLDRPEVFFVSQIQAIEWMRRPQTLVEIGALDAWKCSGTLPGPAVCDVESQKECIYDDPVTGDPTVMVTCSECPPEYPWLGNTAGATQSL